MLDSHAIMPAERTKAKGLIGGDVATLTVAFGKRLPHYDEAWDEKAPERSALEQDLVKVQDGWVVGWLGGQVVDEVGEVTKHACVAEGDCLVEMVHGRGASLPDLAQPMQICVH